MAQHRKRTTDSTDPPGSTTRADNYPNAELPVLQPDELCTIVQNTAQGRLPTLQELQDALRERERALEKADFMIKANRADACVRALSATSTVRMTFKLDGVAVTGYKYRQQQQRRARTIRKPHLDAAIMSVLRNAPDASARDIWNSLSHFDQDDLRIRANDDEMDWDGQVEFEGRRVLASRPPSM